MHLYIFSWFIRQTLCDGQFKEKGIRVVKKKQKKTETEKNLITQQDTCWSVSILNHKERTRMTFILTAEGPVSLRKYHKTTKKKDMFVSRIKSNVDHWCFAIPDHINLSSWKSEIQRTL